MKTTIKLLILILIFGCKNQTSPKNEIISQKKPTKVQISNENESIFNLIIRKKESPKSFTDSIKRKFDFSKRYTKKEISSLNLDTTKIRSNEYYLLSDQNFLKRPIDSVSFLIYYKHYYGNRLSKILRIDNTQLTDLILAEQQSNGLDSYTVSTEFLNDSIFVKTTNNKRTTKDNTHSMTFEIDSIVTQFKYNKKLQFKEIKQDSFRIKKEQPIFHKDLEGKVFKTWSSPFTINKIQCQWEYEVKYTEEANENPKEPIVDLISQKLITWKTKELLLDLDLSKFVYIPPKSISQLEYNEYPNSSIDNLRDVNSDNHIDIQFMTEHAGAGANIAYATYLFDSKNKKFEYSEAFSDYNVQYDPQKNRVSSFMKSGVDNYYYHFKNLKENRKDVEFTENLHHYADTIFYTKIINEKVVEEKKIVLKEYENWEKYLERK